MQARKGLFTPRGGKLWHSMQNTLNYIFVSLKPVLTFQTLTTAKLRKWVLHFAAWIDLIPTIDPTTQLCLRLEIKLTYFPTYSSSFLVKHRSSTRMHHLTLFWPVPFASFQVRCFLSNSAILVLHRVCWGLPLFCLPCGFYSSALLTTCPSSLLNMWSIHPQAICLISRFMGRCHVCL